jgi:hypothetical protein
LDPHLKPNIVHAIGTSVLHPYWLENPESGTCPDPALKERF